MSNFFKYLILTITIILSKSEIEYGTCINDQRIVTLENGTSLSFSCGSCQENEYLFYSLEKENLECAKCPENSYSYSKSGDIVIDTFSKKYLKRYSLLFDINCDSDDKNLCPKWENYILSLKLENIKENVDSKSILKLNQYYYQDGKFIIKYLNYNGDFNKYVHIYINKVLVYKDDTKHSKIKTKEFEIKKGHNEIEIIYIVDKNLSNKNNIEIESFFEIYEIRMEKAETVSLECQKFDLIEDLKNSLINNCDYYIDKCSSNDICTFRFYTENSEGNNIDGTQIISYNKIEGGNCTELVTPSKIEIEADQCSYGQFRKFKENSESIYICDNCEENKYSDKIINYEFSCEGECDTNTKNLKKIYYVNNFTDQSEYSLEINITEIIGYIEINYEKFNLKEDSIIFVEKYIDSSDHNTYQLINPNIQNDIITENFLFKIPFEKGQYKFSIKGKNMKLKEIKVIDGEEGGNYQCVNRLIPEKEIICEKNEYYSPNKKICDKCPYGSFIKENAQCIFTEQIINNKFILDNSLILQNDILYDTKIIQGTDNILYHLFLNPSFPLIYLTKSDSSFQIIGNEFSSVKLIRGINDRGIILSYIYSNYTTYIYLKCNKTEGKNEFVKEEQNESGKYYYFSIESNISCPYCLESEIDKVKTDGKCIDNKELFNIIPKDDSECVIKPYEESKNSKMIINNNDEMLLFYNSTNAEDQNLINNFKITEEIPIFNETETDKIVNETQRYEDCGLEPEDEEEEPEEKEGEKEDEKEDEREGEREGEKEGEKEGEREGEKEDETKKTDEPNKEDDSLGAGYIVLIVVASLILLLAIIFVIWRFIRRKNDEIPECPDDIQELNLKSGSEEK